MKKFHIVLLLCLSGFILIYNYSCTGNSDDQTDDAELISYNFQVRPIFSDKCFKCHGPDANAREAGLRLDIAAEAYKALKEHPRAHAIVPRQPDASELFQRVSTTDTAIQMPPASSNLAALTKDEINILKKWIEQGARYEPHWAFVAPSSQLCPK